MKFKKWLKYIDPVGIDIAIWTDDNKDKPVYEGDIFDIPWYLVDFKIDNTCENPIYFYTRVNEHGVTIITATINLIAE